MIAGMRKKRAVALLLETIFGLGLFAVALVVSLGLIFVVSKGSDSAREYELAEQVGRQYLEYYLAQRPVVPVSLAPFPAPAVPYHTGGASDRTLDLVVNVTVTPAVPYHDVLVNVTWNTGMPRQILLEGYIAN
jgi:hypothetical protein